MCAVNSQQARWFRGFLWALPVLAASVFAIDAATRDDGSALVAYGVGLGLGIVAGTVTRLLVRPRGTRPTKRSSAGTAGIAGAGVLLAELFMHSSNPWIIGFIAVA